ncbi:hypothetical protein [Streptomyces sp. NPDC096311]|uniref:hypothetical protein n=1 Tax=Streptomyces sp. NPDC096311 TaxID=3366083 RepID=UPI003805BE0E
MTAAMKRDADGQLANFRTTTCEDGSEAPDGQELNISHTFLVASGDVLGVRLSTQASTGVGDGLSTKTYWYDGRDRVYRIAPEIVADGSQDAFVAALETELKGREGVDAAFLDSAFGGPGRPSHRTERHGLHRRRRPAGHLRPGPGGRPRSRQLRRGLLASDGGLPN